MLRLIDRLILAIGLPSAGALLLVVMAGVIFRALGHPLSWTDEASGYLMVWCACFGWMAATRKGAHIRIRFFLDRIPGEANRVVRTLFELSLVLLGAVITFKAVHLVGVNYDIEATSMPISSALLYLPLIPAGAVMVLQALIDIAALWRPSSPSTEGAQS
jgi:TRAP-type C4-dicarboxylate transport system permease small subunit